MITERGGILPKTFDCLSVIKLFVESKFNNSE